MTYTRDGDTIRLEMTRDDYGRLLILLGMATGASMKDRAMFRAVLQFVNELNATNPEYTPYELPPAEGVTIQ